MKIVKKHGMVFVENHLVPFKGYKLINLCGIIFCHRGESDKITEVDATHERIHTEQQKEMLVIFFYLWYIIEWLILWMKFHGDSRKAYRQVGFEKEAYMGERNPCYIKNRKRYTWLKYL